MSKPVHQLDLPALDGANPLGFLAALGTLAMLSETDPQNQTRLALWSTLDAFSDFAQSTRRIGSPSASRNPASRKTSGCRKGKIA